MHLPSPELTLPPTMSTSSSNPLLSLIGLGSELAKVRAKTKSRQGSQSLTNGNTEDILKGFENVICQLEELDRAQRLSTKKSLDHVIGKLEETLQDFIKTDIDNADSFKKLAEKCKLLKIQSEEQSPDGDSSSHLLGESSQNQAAPLRSPEESDWKPNPDFESLSEDRKKYVLCFSLFPDDKVIKKKELIYWWVGMGLAPSEGEKMLAELIAKGFIEETTRNENMSSGYKMQASVRYQIGQEDNFRRLLIAGKKGSFHVIHSDNDARFDGEPTPEKIEALLNISEKTFNPGKPNWLSKMKNVKVIHLGSWGHKDYVVVEDTEFLKILKSLGQTKFLSLQGISGIVKLPATVCDLMNLKILDLSACNNLELLPEGIGSLKQLVFLDLSECYLLEHVPKSITGLSNLRVLKGFVINPYLDPNVGTLNVKNASSCAFIDLAELKELRKLTLRTRRMDFPTAEDIQTLLELEQLDTLGIAWVGSASGARTDGDLDRFPTNIKKLDLQTVPRCTASRLLELIAKESYHRLEKLYIKGGGLRELDKEKHVFSSVKVVHLRYLPKLDIEWQQLLKCFPKLSCLEIFECPRLAFFTCDENGRWEL